MHECMNESFVSPHLDSSGVFTRTDPTDRRDGPTRPDPSAPPPRLARRRRRAGSGRVGVPRSVDRAVCTRVCTSDTRIIFTCTRIHLPSKTFNDARRRRAIDRHATHDDGRPSDRPSDRPSERTRWDGGRRAGETRRRRRRRRRPRERRRPRTGRRRRRRRRRRRAVDGCRARSPRRRDARAGRGGGSAPNGNPWEG